MDHLLALVHVGRHHVLHGRTVKIHELDAHIALHLAISSAIARLRLFPELLMELRKQLVIALKIFTQHALYGIAVKTDQLRQQFRRKQWRLTRLFLLKNDLKQGATRQIIAGLGINHLEAFKRQNQVCDIIQRGVVGTVLDITKGTIRIFLDKSNWLWHEGISSRESFFRLAH